MSKYKQVYKDIKQKIEEETWPAGQALPTENELMELYSYSKDTVRKALSLLEMDGYIQKRQGKTSVVVEHGLMTEQFLSEIKTAGELNRKAQHEMKTEVVALYIVQGQEDLMAIFDVDEKVDFYKASRIRTIDGERLEFETSYFDRRIVPYLNKQITETSIYRYLEEELHLLISHSRREITFRFATEEERQYMDLGSYDMVAVVTSIAYLTDGRPFQYGTISYRPDKVSFVTMAKR